jgi:hypothetical protein
MILRDIPKPQNNHNLPVVMKHNFPLLDRLYSLSDVSRGYSLQYAINSVVNLFMDGSRLSIYPPLMLDTTGVVPSSIDYTAGAKWLLTKPGAIGQFAPSPAALKSFQGLYGFLKTTLMNLGATSPAAVNPQIGPTTQGKTPHAIKQQQSRENARDNWDRVMMEKAIEEVNNRFIDLLVNKQEKPINLEIFKGDIDEIKKAFPDENILELFNSGEAGRVKISADRWKNNGKVVKFKYIIDKGSTKKADDEAEQNAIMDLCNLFFKEFPEMKQQIEQTGKAKIGNQEIDFGYAFKRYITSSGIQDGDRIISDIKEQSPQNQGQNQEVEQLKQQMSQAAQAISQLSQRLIATEQKAQKPAKSPTETINYKDVPEDVKRELEAAAGLTPSQIGTQPQPPISQPLNSPVLPPAPNQ